MSHPVYIAPPISCSMDADSSRRTFLSIADQLLGSLEDAQTSLAPEKPVLYETCLTSMPLARRSASFSAAFALLYFHKRSPPLPGRSDVRLPEGNEGTSVNRFHSFT